jgi:DNA topoisomerase-3
MDQVTVDSLGFAGACSWILRDIGAQKENDTSNSFVIFKENMTMSIVNIELEKCYTKPPPFLQEHELIELMDEKSIGTDASMATHVNNIVDRGYVVLCDETGTPLRQSRPPRPGQTRAPRQVGRYMVPTPLGISLMELFEKATGQVTDGNQATTIASLEAEKTNDSSVALLTRPAIRAQMEAQVKQIATGLLDKDKCLDHNLRWFRSRYEQLVGSLSKRDHLDRFASSLEPTKDRLRFWKKLGAFEAPVSAPNDSQQVMSNKKCHRMKTGNESNKKKWYKGKRFQQQR